MAWFSRTTSRVTARASAFTTVASRGSRSTTPFGRPAPARVGKLAGPIGARFSVGPQPPLAASANSNSTDCACPRSIRRRGCWRRGPVVLQPRPLCQVRSRFSQVECTRVPIAALVVLLRYGSAWRNAARWLTDDGRHAVGAAPQTSSPSRAFISKRCENSRVSKRSFRRLSMPCRR
jgi:hypothetical protein